MSDGKIHIERLLKWVTRPARQEAARRRIEEQLKEHDHDISKNIDRFTLGSEYSCEGLPITHKSASYPDIDESVMWDSAIEHRKCLTETINSAKEGDVETVDVETFCRMNQLLFHASEDKYNDWTSSEPVEVGESTYKVFFGAYDVPVAECGEGKYVDLIGIPVDGEFLPVMFTGDDKGDMETAIQLYLDVCEPEKKILTDGGQPTDGDDSGGESLFNDGEEAKDIPRSQLCNACHERKGKPRGGRQMICDPCFGAMMNNEETPDPEEVKPEPEYPVLEYTQGKLARFDKDRYLLSRMMDGRKVALAPWIDDDDIPEDANYDKASPGKPVGHNWPNAETDYEEMKKWLDMVGESKGWFPAARIREHDDRSEERLVLVDMDNVRNPETGEIHPVAAALIEEAESYGQVSVSGTGVHLYVRSTVPSGYNITVEEELEGWEYEAEAGGVPEIEVYPRSRFFAMTGNHLDCTPVEVNSNREFVHGLYEDYGTEKSVGEDVDPPGEEWDPDLSKTEVEDMDKAEEWEEIFDAVAHTDYGDFRLRSEKTQGGSSPTSRKSFDPSWEQSESGTRLGHDDGGWIYRKGGIGLDSLQVVALEERIIHDPSEYPDGKDYVEAVNALRDRGAPIPELPDKPEKQPSRRGPTVERVLLPAIDAASERIGWGMDDSRGAALSQQEVYDRTTRRIGEVMDNSGQAVIDGVMGCGKTYSSFKAAKERDAQVYYAASRVELMDQAVEYALDNGYSPDDILVMPGLFRDCPSAAGDHDDHWEHRIRGLRANAATPKTIHSMLDDIPCEDDKECPYRQKMKFDPDEYDIIIGHYAHLHLPQVVAGRHVVVDEEPKGAFTEEIRGEQLESSINKFLSFDNSPPFDNFTDLVANRDVPDKRKAAEYWFDEYGDKEGWDPDEANAVRFEDANFHAYTAKAVYAILFGERRPSSIEAYKAHVPTDGEVDAAAVWKPANTERGHVVKVRAPPVQLKQYATSVIGLDGTPTTLPEGSKAAKLLTRVPMWRDALALRPDLKRVLSDAERATFLSDTQNINIIQTTQYQKPYSSGKHVSVEKDLALVEAANEQFGYRPTVFSTKAARERLEPAASKSSIDTRDWDHYGNLRGSDEYGSHRLGVLLGSPHYGDEHIATEAALMGHGIEPEGKGNDKDYGSEVGNSLAKAMTEANVAQAALRFGRDGNGAIVCIHTSAVPDWLPVHGEGSVTTTWSVGQREAIEALANGFSGSAEDLADRISVGTRQCRNILNGLADRGVAERHQDPEDGRRYEWEADDVGALPVYGETSLPELDDAEVGEDTEGQGIGYIRPISASSSFDHEVAVHDVPRPALSVDTDTEGGGETALGD